MRVVLLAKEESPLARATRKRSDEALHEVLSDRYAARRGGEGVVQHIHRLSLREGSPTTVAEEGEAGTAAAGPAGGYLRGQPNVSTNPDAPQSTTASVMAGSGKILPHSPNGWFAVKRTANEGEPNGRNTGEGDGAGGLVGAPPEAGGDKSAGGPPARRFSAKRKLRAVSRLLRGEPLELLARELNVTAARLSQWRERALPPPRRR